MVGNLMELMELIKVRATAQNHFYSTSGSLNVTDKLACLLSQIMALTSSNIRSVVPAIG